MCKETKNILIQKSHEDVHQDLSSIRKRNRGKRISFLFLMAILFGIVSAVSNYGTSILMKQSFENTNSLHMLNVSTNKSSSTNSLKFRLNILDWVKEWKICRCSVKRNLLIHCSGRMHET